MNRRTLGGSLLIWGTYFAQLALLPGVGVVARHLGASEAVAGLLTAANGMGSVVGNPLGGYLVDRLGARWVLRVGLVTAVLSVGLLGLPASVGGIFALLALYGATSATLNPAVYALLGERRAGDPGRRAERLARSGISIALASTLASPIALRVLEHGTVGVLGIVLAVAIGLPGLAGYLLLRREFAVGAALAEAAGAEGMGLRVGEVSSSRAATGGDGRRGAPSESRLPWGALLVPCLAAFALIFGQGILGLALTRKGALLGLPGWMTGAFFSAFAVATLMIFATPIARRLDRAPRSALAALGIGMAVVGLLTMGLSPVAWPIFVGMGFYGLGFGIIFPVCGAMVADVTPEPHLGRGYGLFYGMFSLGGILGPILAGVTGGVDPFLMGVGPMGLALVVAGLQATRKRRAAAY